VSRSFGLVETKVAEAEFFLRQMRNCGFNVFQAQCYLSAFSSAARSITFALRASIGDIRECGEWYALWQAKMKSNVLCKFFNELRRVSLLSCAALNLVGNELGVCGMGDYFSLQS
jgi:hypothetical protein